MPGSAFGTVTVTVEPSRLTCTPLPAVSSEALTGSGASPGGVLTDGEGGVDAALAVGAAVGSGSVALTQATGQQAQGVLTGGVLGGVFVILEGCVVAGGQVNPGVDMAVLIGGDDSQMVRLSLTAVASLRDTLPSSIFRPITDAFLSSGLHQPSPVRCSLPP